MADEFVENTDWESILRSERKIAQDPQGPTPNEIAHGLGLKHPVLDPDSDKYVELQYQEVGKPDSKATRS